eukprot:TRINITY_DN20805_c0_g1_i1.p1 TRINITY_DN20805_c0_g1~~TRINITY_DN20805_c0_g1_i1.p1  ORF type:complete len:1059 (+),score=164.24 TRINITY_DN20805_c0_g1_i1:346-3177(+)
MSRFKAAAAFPASADAQRTAPLPWDTELSVPRRPLRGAELGVLPWRLPHQRLRVAALPIGKENGGRIASGSACVGASWAFSGGGAEGKAVFRGWRVLRVAAHHTVPINVGTAKGRHDTERPLGSGFPTASAAAPSRLLPHGLELLVLRPVRWPDPGYVTVARQAVLSRDVEDHLLQKPVEIRRGDVFGWSLNESVEVHEVLDSSLESWAAPHGRNPWASGIVGVGNYIVADENGTTMDTPSAGSPCSTGYREGTCAINHRLLKRYVLGPTCPFSTERVLPLLDLAPIIEDWSEAGHKHERSFSSLDNLGPRYPWLRLGVRQWPVDPFAREGLQARNFGLTICVTLPVSQLFDGMFKKWLTMAAGALPRDRSDRGEWERTLPWTILLSGGGRSAEHTGEDGYFGAGLQEMRKWIPNLSLGLWFANQRGSREWAQPAATKALRKATNLSPLLLLHPADSQNGAADAIAMQAALAPHYDDGTARVFAVREPTDDTCIAAGGAAEEDSRSPQPQRICSWRPGLDIGQMCARRGTASKAAQGTVPDESSLSDWCVVVVPEDFRWEFLQDQGEVLRQIRGLPLRSAADVLRRATMRPALDISGLGRLGVHSSLEDAMTLRHQLPLWDPTLGAPVLHLFEDKLRVKTELAQRFQDLGGLSSAPLMFLSQRETNFTEAVLLEARRRNTTVANIEYVAKPTHLAQTRSVALRLNMKRVRPTGEVFMYDPLAELQENVRIIGAAMDRRQRDAFDTREAFRIPPGVVVEQVMWSRMHHDPPWLSRTDELKIWVAWGTAICGEWVVHMPPFRVGSMFWERTGNEFLPRKDLTLSHFTVLHGDPRFGVADAPLGGRGAVVEELPSGDTRVRAFPLEMEWAHECLFNAILHAERVSELMRADFLRVDLFSVGTCESLVLSEVSFSPGGTGYSASMIGHIEDRVKAGYFGAAESSLPV